MPPADFPLLVPRPLLDRIRPAILHDPLLVQVLPLHDELAAAPGFAADPVGEAEAACCPVCCGSTAAEASW